MGIAAEHGFADALLDHSKGLPVAELASLVGINAERLSRVMRLLATRHCFIEGTFFRDLVAGLANLTLLDPSTVSPNVWANNHLSLMLLKTSTEASIVGVYTEECLRAASYLRDVWNDEEWSASNESSRSAFAWSVKNEVNDKTMFEWFKLHVRVFLLLLFVKYGN